MNDNKLIEPNFKDKGKEFVLATSSSKTKKKHKKRPKVRPQIMLFKKKKHLRLERPKIKCNVFVATKMDIITETNNKDGYQKKNCPIYLKELKEISSRYIFSRIIEFELTVDSNDHYQILDSIAISNICV